MAILPKCQRTKEPRLHGHSLLHLLFLASRRSYGQIWAATLPKSSRCHAAILRMAQQPITPIVNRTTTKATDSQNESIFPSPEQASAIQKLSAFDDAHVLSCLAHLQRLEPNLALENIIALSHLCSSPPERVRQWLTFSRLGAGSLTLFSSQEASLC